MTAIRVEVTARLIAAAGHTRVAWARPVEAALAALTGVQVSIDGGDDDGDGANVATIGTTDDATLVIDLPAAANDFLNLRWEDAVPGEPFSFDLVIPDWLVAFVNAGRGEAGVS